MGWGVKTKKQPENIVLKKKFAKIIISWNWSLLATLWLSILLGFLHKKYALLSGVIGFEINDYLQDFIGKTGLAIALIFLLLVYLVTRYKVTFDKYLDNLKSKREKRKAQKIIDAEKDINELETDEEIEKVTEPINLSSDKKDKSEFELSLENLKPTISKHSDVTSLKEEIPLKVEENLEPVLKTENVEQEKSVEIDVEKIAEEENELQL